jgi:hypothetical protein
MPPHNIIRTFIDFLKGLLNQFQMAGQGFQAQKRANFKIGNWTIWDKWQTQGLLQTMKRVTRTNCTRANIPHDYWVNFFCTFDDARVNQCSVGLYCPAKSLPIFNFLRNNHANAIAAELGIPQRNIVDIPTNQAMGNWQANVNSNQLIFVEQPRGTSYICLVKNLQNIGGEGVLNNPNPQNQLIQWYLSRMTQFFNAVMPLLP